MADSAVSIALLYPELLGTYGDGGNAVVLAQRLQWRGMTAEIVEVGAGTPVPESCDVYLMGGGEDGPQTLAADELSESGALHRAVEGGAVLFAVCAGFQVLGKSFAVPDTPTYAGLGLLDIRTVRGPGTRMVGELLVEPAVDGLGVLTGYENHASVTSLGPGVRPLGRAVAGFGNGAGDQSEGAVSGKVAGTYLHGPALARNPALADLLLSWIEGIGALKPLDDAEVDDLRTERLHAVRAKRWRRRPR